MFPNFTERLREDSSTRQANLISCDKMAVKVIKVELQTPEGKTVVLDELLGRLAQHFDYIRDPFVYFVYKKLLVVLCKERRKHW